MDVDTQLEGPSKVPKPHDFLWFRDGNVVLATDTYFFKVHKSLLSVHSSVFKDMFELPNVGHGDQIPGQAGTGLTSEAYEGIPMVTMVGDKGEDVAHLLRAVFEPNYYHRDDDDTPLEVIVALLLLSTKYDFNGVRKNVIRHLSRLYPMTLKEYEAAFHDDALLFGQTREKCDFSILAAAVTADVDVLLPSLFFACSNYSIYKTLDQMQSMPRDALHTLICGRDSSDLSINKFIVSLPSRLRQLTIVDCQNGMYRSCFAEASSSELNLEGYIQTEFESFTGAMIVEDCFGPICEECKSVVESMVGEKRKEIWEGIPIRYKFPEWGVLQDKLKAILESFIRTSPYTAIAALQSAAEINVSHFSPTFPKFVHHAPMMLRFQQNESRPRSIKTHFDLTFFSIPLYVSHRNVVPATIRGAKCTCLIL